MSGKKLCQEMTAIECVSVDGPMILGKKIKSISLPQINSQTDEDVLTIALCNDGFST